MPVRVDQPQIGGHFVEDAATNRVLFDEPPVRRLNERLVGAAAGGVDLLDGAENWEEARKCPNKLRGVLEFLQARMLHSGGGLSAAVGGADVVSRQSLLNRVATTPFFRDSAFDPGFSFVACLLGGVLFLCELPEAAGAAGRRRNNAFIRAKLEHLLTADSPEADVKATAAKSWNVLSACTLEADGGAHRLLLATTASAVDGLGNYVQILPFAASGPPRLPVHLQLRYALLGVLSGQRRVIGGQHEPRGGRLQRVVELDAAALLQDGQEANAERGLEYLVDLLARVRAALQAAEDGLLLHVQRPKKQSAVEMRPVPPDQRAQFDFVGEEFRRLVQQSAR
ncbi:Decapping nuclease [Aphelenchoides fujianensis]|nr:Decapping nuclease [Aphelenchoides fujianensis]